MPSPQIYKNIEHSIQQYSHEDTTTLKKLALSIIAHDSTMNRTYASESSSNDSTIDQLQKAFTQFDTEKNGILSYDEFKAAILQTVSQQRQSFVPSDGTEGDTESIKPHDSDHESSQSLPYTEKELERIFASLVGEIVILC